MSRKVKEVKRKASYIKETKNKVDPLETGGSTCHESISRDEYENDKETMVVEKGKFFNQKDMENKEIKKNMRINQN